MKNILRNFLLIAVFSACESANNGNFEVVNNSDFDLDSVSIHPDSNEQFQEIKKGTSSTIITNMDNAEPEGSYLLSFKNSIT